MTAYLLRRFLLAVPTLIGITLIVFVMVQLAPGSPWSMRLMGATSGSGEQVSEEIVEQTKKLYGFDKPILVRYLVWLRQIVTLDFGKSYQDQRPVLVKVWEAAQVTMVIDLIVILIIYLIAIPLGVFSATHQDSFWDRASTVVVFLLYSLPSFWVALLLILFLGGGRFLNLFPIYGLSSDGAEALPLAGWLLDRAWHLVLPVICLTYGGFAGLSRYARGGMLDVIRQDYIRTARAKGLSEKVVIYKHAFRNSMIPIVTLLSTLLPALLGGSVIIEQIFSIPGMGRLGFQSVLARDYPVTLSLAVISATLVLISLILQDVLYVLVDPRISFDSRR